MPKGVSVIPVHEYAATLEEVGQELGVSREYARKLQNQALEKLRKGLEARGFTLENLFGPEGAFTDLPDAPDCQIEWAVETDLVTEESWRQQQKRQREQQQQRDERLLQQCYDRGSIRRTTRRRRAKLPR